MLAGRGDHGDLAANQFGRQRRQSIHLILGPAVFDRYVLALDVAALLQALAECAQTVRAASGDAEWRNPITGIARLLRARRERPRRRRAAEKPNELTSPHIRTQAQGPALYRLKRVL